MQRTAASQSAAARTVWAVVLAAAIAAVILNFVSNPSNGGPLSRVAEHVTLWVPAAAADPIGEVVAQQTSGYWTAGRQSSSVGTLSGPAQAAVARFLRRGDPQVRQAAASANLLVLTSSTLSSVATGRRGQLLIERAPVVSVLARDPLELAVGEDSPLHSGAALLAALRADPGQRLFAAASDPWLAGNLAALVAGAKLDGKVFYAEMPSSGAAVESVQAGESQVVLAPRSALEQAVRKHRLRVLPWPEGKAPETWVALTAPVGTSARQLAKLQRQAKAITGQPGWRSLLASEGLTPVSLPTGRLRSFLRAGAANAQRLQALAARMIES